MTNKSTIITLTPAAYAHIQSFLQPMSANAGFRIGVKKSGCSGFAYILDVVEQPQTDDLCFVQENLRIFIAADSVPVLQGSELDLINKDVNQKQLVVNNPNVVDSCGCGESFTVKSEEGTHVD